MNSEVRKQILWAAIEDYCGLYEVLWELNTTHPHVPEVDRRRAAKECISAMLRRGWLNLCWMRWGTGESRANLIPPSEHAEILSSGHSWEPAPGRGKPYVVIDATPAGKRAYADKAWERNFGE